MKVALLMTLFFSLVCSGKSSYSAKRLNQLSGEKSSKFDTKSSWDLAYSRPSFIFGKSPAKFLAENFDFLAPNSNVLDMGMGEGRNAVFLAQKGHKVTGIDISSVAIKKAHMLAKEFGVKVKGVVASLEKYSIPENSFDAIICFYYVDRKLAAKIKKWLKPGGVLVYEAYTEKQKNKKNHQKYSEDQYLRPGELLEMFKGMKLLKYEEPLHESVFRASVIFQKPI
ncbi:MAG: class I SAM-dependent methyltransferase [Bacteriovoracaceae bacterium]